MLGCFSQKLAHPNVHEAEAGRAVRCRGGKGAGGEGRERCGGGSGEGGHVYRRQGLEGRCK